MIRMILTDLDHTLLRQDGGISDETLMTVKKCREKGVLFAVATARFWLRAEKYIRLLEPDYAITADGALIHAHGEFIYSREFTQAEASMIAERIFAAAPDTEITAVLGKELYVKRRGDTAPLPAGINKLVAVLPDETAAERIAHEAGCSLQGYRGEDLYAFMPKGAGKVDAIRALAELSGIPLEDFAAFGDDSNDIGILKMCGTGVAVANAIPEALEAADDVTLSNDDDGVAVWLRKKLLGGEQAPDEP